MLVVGEADVGRAPLVARLFAQRGLDATSAGIQQASWPVHKHTVTAAKRVGVGDLGAHVPRVLDVDLLIREGRRLAVTMTREQVFTLSAYDASFFRTTFTLPELARRCVALGVVDSYDAWIAAVGEGRTANDLSPGSPNDDVVDPYGLTKRAHIALAEAADTMVAAVVASMGWLDR